MTQQAQATGVSLDLRKAVAQTGIPITPDPNAPPNTNSGFTSWFAYGGPRIVETQSDAFLLDVSVAVAIAILLDA
jgi:hypothetical protein